MENTLKDKLNELNKDDLIKIILELTSLYVYTKTPPNLEKQEIQRNIITNIQEIEINPFIK